MQYLINPCIYIYKDYCLKSKQIKVALFLSAADKKLMTFIFSLNFSYYKLFRVIDSEKWEGCCKEWGGV